MRGAATTIASVMPVSATIIGGMGIPGSTRVWNSPMTSPPRVLTAPISVMALVRGEPPVVSRSTITKVTEDSGSPISSSATCRGEPAARSGGDVMCRRYSRTSDAKPCQSPCVAWDA